MKRISLLVLVLLLAVNYGSCWRRRRRRSPPPPPIHGGWTSWGPYDSCGQLCGGSTQHRTRSCTNPSPAHGGRGCPGASIETRSCNTQPCPVNGRWSNWGVYSICSKSCGGGNHSRSRQCNNPSPGYGGRNCSGASSESISCNEQQCPVNGAWSEWMDVGTCSRICGGGTQHRNRQCTNPSPAHGGRDCSGVPSESRNCNTQPCPVHGAWNEWGKYEICSKSCGGGKHSRSRQCANPSPSHGGRGCSGVSSESKVCNMQTCPAGNHLVDVKFIVLTTGIAVLAIVVVVALLKLSSIKKRNMQVQPYGNGRVYVIGT